MQYAIDYSILGYPLYTRCFHDAVLLEDSQQFSTPECLGCLLMFDIIISTKQRLHQPVTLFGVEHAWL